MLRTARRFPLFYRALSVSLVEISPKLINEQKAALGCVGSLTLPGAAGVPADSSDIVQGVLPDGKQINWFWYDFLKEFICVLLITKPSLSCI